MISALKNGGDLPIEFIDKFHEIDRTAFQNGQKNMKEQMMKEAVEGWVSSTKGDHFGCVTSVPTDLGKLYVADKCKLIIVKED